MAETRTRVTVIYERDEDGWWFTRVRGIQGCHTQGRTIEEARRRIREALSLYRDDAATVELVDEVKLDASARQVLRLCTRARQRSEREQERARGATAEAVRTLTTKVGLSVRDAAQLLGLSHQRIQQILHAEDAA